MFDLNPNHLERERPPERCWQIYLYLSLQVNFSPTDSIWGWNFSIFFSLFDLQLFASEM